MLAEGPDSWSAHATTGSDGPAWVPMPDPCALPPTCVVAGGVRDDRVDGGPAAQGGGAGYLADVRVLHAAKRDVAPPHGLRGGAPSPRRHEPEVL
eukprot:13931939-Heterocapsa_arctica.AAC.1